MLKTSLLKEGRVEWSAFRTYLLSDCKVATAFEKASA